MRIQLYMYSLICYLISRWRMSGTVLLIHWQNWPLSIYYLFILSSLFPQMLPHIISTALTPLQEMTAPLRPGPLTQTAIPQSVPVPAFWLPCLLHISLTNHYFLPLTMIPFHWVLVQVILFLLSSFSIHCFSFSCCLPRNPSPTFKHTQVTYSIFFFFDPVTPSNYHYISLLKEKLLPPLLFSTFKANFNPHLLGQKFSALAAH